jgi:hypothetical protein
MLSPNLAAKQVLQKGFRYNPSGQRMGFVVKGGLGSGRVVSPFWRRRLNRPPGEWRRVSDFEPG